MQQPVKVSSEAIREINSPRRRRWVWWKSKPLALAGIGIWCGMWYWIGCLMFQ